MPIETQVVPFLFDAGLTQEIDDQIAGGANVATNSVFRRRGRAQKRLPMQDPLDESTADSDSVGYPIDQPMNLLPVGKSLAVQGNATVRLHQATTPVLQPELYTPQAPIERIVVTDTIPHGNRFAPIASKIVELSVAELLGEAIGRIHSNQSISDLFGRENLM